MTDADDGGHDFQLTGHGSATRCTVCNTHRPTGKRPALWIELGCDDTLRQKDPVRYLELKFSRACRRAAENFPEGSEGRRAFEELAEEVLSSK